METKAKILLILYLFSFTSLKEFLKLPVLVHHYIHHVHEHPDMSVQEFFTMHYLRGIIIDEDFDQDMKLPFKSVDLSNFNIIGIYVQSHRDYLMTNIPIQIQQKIQADYSLLYQNPNLGNIFHPPRV